MYRPAGLTHHNPSAGEKIPAVAKCQSAFSSLSGGGAPEEKDPDPTGRAGGSWVVLGVFARVLLTCYQRLFLLGTTAQEKLFIYEKLQA